MSGYKIEKNVNAWGNGPFENDKATDMLYDFVGGSFTDYLINIFSEYLLGTDDVDMEEAYAALRLMHIIGVKTPALYSTNLFDQAIKVCQTMLLQEHWLDRFPNPAQVRIYISKLRAWLTGERVGTTSFEPIEVDEEKIKSDTTMIMRKRDTRIFTTQVKNQIRRETGQIAVNKPLKRK